MITQFTNQITTKDRFCVSSGEDDYQRLLSSQDLMIRTIRNSKFSDVNVRLYLSLVDTYPSLLDGQRTEISVWEVRKNAGEKSDDSATRFFKDLDAIGAIKYELIFDRKTGARKSFVTPLLDFDAPEIFDTKSIERKKKAAAAERKRKGQFIDPRKINMCENCGSTNLVYAATPSCLDCFHIHQTIENIPARDIIIEAEIIEAADDIFAFDSFLDQPTEKMQAVRPAPVQALLPEPALPPMPDVACRKCGRPRKVCFRQGEEGLWWHSCE